MVDRKITIMITGAGAPGAPGIIKSLRKPFVKEREIRIVGTDIRLNSAGFGMVEEQYLVPHAGHKNFISEMLRIAKKENVKIILPLVTKELLSFAQNKEKFKKEGIIISVSESISIIEANNKYLLMKKAQENDIPVPQFKLVKNFFDFKEAINKFNYPKENVSFKPPISNGMRGFRVLTEKVDRYDLLMNKKPYNVLTSFKDIASILEKAKPFPELLVMEYLPGEEYSVDVFADNGKPIIAIPRKREKIKMGISFVGKTEKDKEIIEYSKRLIKIFNLHGNIGFQFKRNKLGIPCLIECNPRLQGTIVLSVWSGANLPYLAIKQALGEKYFVPKIEWGKWVMVRYWDEIYYTREK